MPLCGLPLNDRRSYRDAASLGNRPARSISGKPDPSRRYTADRRDCQKKIIILHLDVLAALMPVAFEGFDPTADYYIYSVTTEAAMNYAAFVSDSAVSTIAKE